MSLQDEFTDSDANHNDERSHNKLDPSSEPFLLDDFIQGPSAVVQNMLKTSTEVGEISQLHHPDIHLSHLGSQFRPTKRLPGMSSLSFASALQRQRSSRYGSERGERHDVLRQQAANAGIARHDTIQTSLSADIYSPRKRGSKARSSRNSVKSGIQSPHALPPRTLQSHRSLTTLRSYNGRRRHSGKSSTHSFTDGLPRYRTNDSILRPSNMFRAPKPNSQPGSRDSSIRSSPASSFVRHGASGHPQRSGGSGPSLLRLSSPAFSKTYPPYRSRYRPLVTRPPDLSMGWGFTHSSGSNQQANVSPILSTAKHAIPRYYDYSESFVEHECFSPDSRGLRSVATPSIDETILQSDLRPNLQRTSSPVQVKVEPAFLPAESPTDKVECRSGSSSSKYEEVTSHVINDGNGYQRGQNERTLPAAMFDKQVIHVSETAASTGLSDARHCSVISHRTRASSNAGIFFLNGEKSQRDLTALAARVHSQPVVSTVTDNEQDWLRRRGTSASASNLEILPPLCDKRPNSSPVQLHSKGKVLSTHTRRPVSSHSQRAFRTVMNAKSDTESYPRELYGPGFDGLGIINPTPTRRLWRSLNLGPSGFSRNGILGIPSPDSMHMRLMDKSNLQQSGHIVALKNQSKSTIESLLDKHIESLGLGSDHKDSTNRCLSHHRDQSENSNASRLQSSELLLWEKLDDISKTLGVTRDESFTFNDRMCSMLRPRKLFEGVDRKRSASLELKLLPSFSQQRLMDFNNSRAFSSWSTLPSTEGTQLWSTPGKCTLGSGELADIDTSDVTRKLKSWDVSQFSLPTSTSGISSAAFDMNIHQSSNTEASSPNKSPLSAIIGSNFEHRVRSNSLDTSKLETHRSISRALSAPFARHQSLRSVADVVPIHDGKFRSEAVSDSDKSTLPLSSTTKYPALYVPAVRRRSAASAEGRVNSTVLPQRASTLQAGNKRTTASTNHVLPRTTFIGLADKVPQLAWPNFGPPLNASTMNLDIALAQAHARTRYAIRDPENNVDGGTCCTFGQSVRAKFRLSDLGKYLHQNRSSSTQIHVHEQRDFTTRTDASQSDQRVFDLQFDESELLEQQHAHTDNMTSKKRRTVDRLKNWWRRQCASRLVTSQKRRSRSSAREREVEPVHCGGIVIG